MVSQSLEQRVTALEAQVGKLQAEVRTANGQAKDWRRTIRACNDDEGMK